MIQDGDNIFLNAFCYFSQFVKNTFITWEWNSGAGCVSCNSRWVGGPLILSFPLYFPHFLHNFNNLNFASFNYQHSSLCYSYQTSIYYMLRLNKKSICPKLKTIHTLSMVLKIGILLALDISDWRLLELSEYIVFARLLRNSENFHNIQPRPNLE